jgi:NAD(P)-dependent dehydrogenase (short-subunit alcohol dehydrogenase family)
MEVLMPSILITGSSSGYGLETARHFLAQGWRVIATMRRPAPGILPDSDALVNNAGIGCAGAFEATPMDHVRRIFETNTFGVMAMTQAVIPQMRQRRAGVIVNVTSTATLAPMPLVSVYTASKQAIEGFTGSLALELAHFGIAAKLVEPGYGPTTRFGQNNPVPAQTMIPAEYGPYASEVFGGFAAPQLTTTETDVAQAVWTAVHDRSDRLRFPAGADAVALFEAT